MIKQSKSGCPLFDVKDNCDTCRKIKEPMVCSDELTHHYCTSDFLNLVVEKRNEINKNQSILRRWLYDY